MATVNVRDTLVNLTSRLIQINTVNPPGLTSEASSFIKDWLGSLGYSCEIREYVKGKPNVVARVGKGSPTLILNGHMDVVPPGDESRWSYPPFSGKVVGDRIYGRGATDMKGGLAVVMLVFAELAPLVERAGSGTLVFSATADEEVGGHAGVEALVKDGVLVGDAAIVAEPTGFNRYCIGEKGLCQLRLIARGRPAHGSLPILGENAILKLVKAIEGAQRIVEEFNRNIKLPPDVEEAAFNAASIYGQEASRRGLGLSLEDFRRVIGSVSFNPGVIRGGSKVNMVPDYAELELDMRVPPGVDPAGLIEAVKSGLRGLAEVEPIDVSSPNYTPRDSPIVRLIEDGIRRLGAEPKPIIMTGATDGRYLRARGIPTVIYGPGELTLAHAYDEYVTVNDLVNTYNVMLYASSRFFNIPSPG